MQVTHPGASRRSGARAVRGACAVGLAACAWLYFATGHDRANVVPPVPAPPDSISMAAAGALRATRDESPVKASAPAAPFTAPSSPSGPSPMSSAAWASLPADRAGAPDLVIAAPLEAIHGTTFKVTVGVASHNTLRSVHVRLSYDADALELIEIVDSSGTTFATMPNGDGSVDLDMDDIGSAVQMPAATFLARVTEPRTVEFSARAELRDAEGRTVNANAIAPAAMMLVP